MHFDGKTKWRNVRPPAFGCGLLVLCACLAGCNESNLTEQAAAQPQPLQAGALNLGRIWRVEEGYYDEAHWVGVWTRRGESKVFDATWKHCWMDETKQDVVEVQLARDGQVVVFRRAIKQHYRGTYAAGRPNKLQGRGDWYGPDLLWQGEIEY
ncbi:MAG: hypothetical protein FJW26_09680 [Acidimicrobiia bacterium]|nr:hypothetical protein [Acidimicrobiia bacterium]